MCVGRTSFIALPRLVYVMELKLDKVVVALLVLLTICIGATGCVSEEPGAPLEPQPPASAAPAQPAAAAQSGPSSPPAQPMQPAQPKPSAPAKSTSEQVGAAAAPTQARTGDRSSRPSPAEPTPIPAVFPVSVQAGDGREITFDSPPERIVAFDSAVVEILFAIGEGDRIVGTHQYVSYPPEVAEIAKVGDAFNMDIEATVALEPDLVFVFFDRFVQDLERAGLKVLYIPSLTDDFEKIAEHIRAWGRIVGNPDSAEAVARDFEGRVASIRETMEPVGAGPKVLQDVGGFWTPGKGTMMQEVFDLLKLENVAHDIDGYAQISPEVIVERDPTVIITSSPESFTDEPAFESVRAVRHGNLVTLGSDALSVQGPRFIKGVEEMARLVYPGVFE